MQDVRGPTYYDLTDYLQPLFQERDLTFTILLLIQPDSDYVTDPLRLISMGGLFDIYSFNYTY